MRIRLRPSKIVEKSPSRAKCKGKRLRKCRRSDDERGSSNPSSESESELEEQVKQRKTKQNIKVNSSRTKADERKNVQKGQVMSQNMNMMTGSAFMPMMTVNWQIT